MRIRLASQHNEKPEKSNRYDRNLRLVLAADTFVCRVTKN